MSRWLLVELKDGAPWPPMHPSYRQMTDLSAISRATLDQWLLPKEHTWEYQRKRDGGPTRNAHRRWRQPRLL